MTFTAVNKARAPSSKKVSLLISDKKGNLMLSELIEALQIALKYGDNYCPTSAEHDVLYLAIDGEVSVGDTERLDELGFYWDEELEVFYSFRYGSR